MAETEWPAVVPEYFLEARSVVLDIDSEQWVDLAQVQRVELDTVPTWKYVDVCSEAPQSSPVEGTA